MLEIFPWQTSQRAMNLSDTIKRCSKEILESKKVALEQGDEAVSRQIAEGKDIMSKLRQYYIL